MESKHRQEDFQYESLMFIDQVGSAVVESPCRCRNLFNLARHSVRAVHYRNAGRVWSQNGVVHWLSFQAVFGSLFPVGTRQGDPQHLDG